MKLKKLIKNMLYLQEVTIYDVDTDVEFYTNETVSEIVNCDSTYENAKICDMQVMKIFTDWRKSEDVIYIGVRK